MKLRRGKSLLLGLSASALLLISAACSKEKNDAQIIGEVATRIQRDAQVPNKNIAISSNQGVVTLNGSANSEAERTAASNDAARVEGVRTVINNLSVAAPAPTQAAVVEPPPASAPAPEPAPVRGRSAKPSASHARSERRMATVAAPTTTSATTSSGNSNQPMSNTGIVNTTPMPAPTPASTPTTTNNSAPAKSDAVLIPPPPLPVKMINIDAGTSLTVRLNSPIDTSRNRQGDTFSATLDSPLYAEDQVAVPAGATVEGRIVDIQDSGRFAGRAQLGLVLTSLNVNGRRYQLQTNQYTKQGNSQGTRTATSVGAGAAIGALIGAIAGGGKGAAIGAGVGAAGGGGVQAARGTQPVRLNTEARLNFRLESPLSVSPQASIDRGYRAANNSSDNSSWKAGAPSNDTYSNDEPAPVDTPEGDRPVLKRRPGSSSNDSNNQPPPQ